MARDDDSSRTDALAGLTDEQRAAAVYSEQLWRLANTIVEGAPGVDLGDVYHALRCLELSPSKRLQQGLARGRLRAHAS